MQQKAKKTISHVTPVRPLTDEEKKERVIRFLAQKREQYAISILQGIVANPAAALVQFIDSERPEGSMCCSNAECERLEKAFEVNNLDFVEYFMEKKLSRLTEFETHLKWLIENGGSGIEHVKVGANELLAIAKKELQPEIDAEIEKAYKTQDDVVFRKGWEHGRADALKDLPRWIRDDSIKAEQYITVGKNGSRFHYKGHSLLISDLTKLPGFKED